MTAESADGNKVETTYFFEEWPGDSIAFLCDQNRGRSVFASALFRIKFRRVEEVHSFAVSPRYSEILFPRVLDPDVLKILKINNLPIDDEQTYLGNYPFNPMTDYVVLTDRFGKEEDDEQRRLLDSLKDAARSVVCIPIPERTKVGDGERAGLLSSDRSRSEVVSRIFDDVRDLVFFKLKPIMQMVRRGEYKKHNGVIYPLGAPEIVDTTARYLKDNFGRTGEF